MKTAKVIQNIYYNIYVRKEEVQYFYKYHKTLQQLHAQYLKTHKVNTIDTVYKRLLEIPGSSLYWMIYN